MVLEQSSIKNKTTTHSPLAQLAPRVGVKLAQGQSKLSNILSVEVSGSCQ